MTFFGIELQKLAVLVSSSLSFAKGESFDISLPHRCNECFKDENSKCKKLYIQKTIKGN